MPRLDVYITMSGGARSRNVAQRMIDSGNVFVNGVIVKKSSFIVNEGDHVELYNSGEKYVGRGGYKLEGALETFGIDVSGKKCADIGASTGGFTDCLLQNGAAKVYAIDCGHGQLDEKLKNDKRVVNIEGFNAKELSQNTTDGKCDIVVMDVSFISQIKLYGNVRNILSENGYFISLIKPQFEAGSENVGKNGIVKSDEIHLSVLNRIFICSSMSGLYPVGFADSPIRGGDGNREFLGCFSADISRKNEKFDFMKLVYGK